MYVKNITIALIAVISPCVVAWLASPTDFQIVGMPVLFVFSIGIFLTQWMAFVPAGLLRTERFYDLTGSITYIGFIGAALSISTSPSVPQIIISALVIIWATRLGLFLVIRMHRSGGDRRFDAIKTSWQRFFLAWTLQGAWIVLTSCAALTAIMSPLKVEVSGLFVLGAWLWIVGFSIEVIADRQKLKFRENNKSLDHFIATGLWARCRHPNYFGEIVLWSGIAIMAMPMISGNQWVTMLSPIFVYWLLTNVSGIPPLTLRGQELWGRDPAYQDYLDQTPRLLPKVW